ncbi:hypothetical protein [uncultured Algibacter sp.]|uniref:Kelch repeat-containing protein n=1 Tax=uncultured Algibacter sp. TaxID=298659 RepID=UPI00260A56E7|nr:hypothetical protein [uncultured Algibacter sp.]
MTTQKGTFSRFYLKFKNAPLYKGKSSKSHKVSSNYAVWGLYSLICLLVLNSYSYLIAQTTQSSSVWIDLDEDESYTARHECSFVQAGDKFVLFGGRESAQKLDIYDFKSNSWSIAKNQAPKEFNHFQATFYKGFIWVIGAFKTNNFPHEVPEDNIWLYHPPNDIWIKGPEIPEDRRRGGSGLIIYKDKFYIIGGNTKGHNGGFVNWFDEYDPYKNTWIILENASQARDHFSAAVINDTLYAMGGRQSGGSNGVFAPLISTVDTYNFITKTWSTLPQDLPTPRAAPGIAVFKNQIFVMGGEGETDGPAYKTVESYNPISGQWTKESDMNYPRHGTQAIQSGNGIYIAAGSPKRGGGKQLNMEVYNSHSAKGNPITTSIIKSPQAVDINIEDTSFITSKNINGNSASFINSIKITGENAYSFKLISNLNHTLIHANSEFLIKVKHLNKNKGEKASLEIKYNGNIINRIQLKSI